MPPQATFDQIQHNPYRSPSILQSQKSNSTAPLQLHRPATIPQPSVSNNKMSLCHVSIPSQVESEESDSGQSESEEEHDSPAMLGGIVPGTGKLKIYS